MSKQFSAMLDRLLDGNSLAELEAYELMVTLAEGELNPALAGALLAGLRAKGETPDEIRGFATAMRELAVHPAIPDGAPTVDTVGTGGDGSGSLNLSTGTGLLAAAAGARVVKHGNRSVSSRSGSADMLECLGMPLPLHEKEAVACLEATSFTFLFAPAYHPAMKAVVPVRGALAVRTVFNMLGPLTNPAAPPFQLIGAWSNEAARLMADTLSGMPIERAFVVHGAPNWDEATPVGEFVLYDVRPGSVTETVRTPEDYKLPRCTPEDLAGGDLTTEAVVPEGSRAIGRAIAREPLVACGGDVFARCFYRVDPGLRVERRANEGEHVDNDAVLWIVEGATRSILMAERTALNFAQHLSGVATRTARYVTAITEGSRTRITDTRKTTPGLRALERYAVRTGGAFNHRDTLGSAVLIKDNHIEAAGGVRHAVERARAHAPHTSRVEVEVESMEALEEALDAGADIVMLDNFEPREIAGALELASARALIEVPGGITLERVAALSRAGVDIISVGALTHSAAVLDLSLLIATEKGAQG